jgi:hypothetical protein
MKAAAWLSLWLAWLLPLLCSGSPANRTAFCSGQEPAGTLVRAPVVVLARARGSLRPDRRSALTVRVAAAWKQPEEGTLKPADKLRVHFPPGGACRRIKKGDKVVLPLAEVAGGWEVLGPVLAPSRRLRRLQGSGQLCSAGPVLRPAADQLAVREGSWRRLACRLRGPAILRTDFQWTFEDRPVPWCSNCSYV